MLIESSWALRDGAKKVGNVQVGMKSSEYGGWHGHWQHSAHSFVWIVWHEMDIVPMRTAAMLD